MKLGLNTKQRILGSIIVILVLVGIVGFSTYQQFSDVVTKVSATTTEDPSISKTKRILEKISESENQIKRYTLTEDSVHFDAFNAIRKEVDFLLIDLKNQKNFVAGSIEIDTFQSLVQRRFIILDKRASIQDEFRVGAAFENVSAQINAVEKVKTTPAPKTKSWFRRSSKKDPVAPNIDISKVTDNIKEIKVKETHKEEIQIEQELELLDADNQNALALQSVMDEILLAEKARDRKNVQDINDLVTRTNFQIIAFCAVICLLLILTSFTIAQYIRRNSAYRVMLNKAKMEAESLASAKALFVATVSHEIRTPVNIISGFSEQLAQSKLTNEQHEQLLGIKQSSSHLLDLVNSVLDFSKLENDKLILEKNYFSPNELVSTVHSLTSQLIENNDVTLKSFVDSTVPEVLIGDVFRLRQILLNLVGNAIKFTAGGQVDIHLSCTESEDKSIQLTLIVEDNGIGMTQDQLLTVFDEFVQANESTTRLYGGTGLGLPITKKLVELQNGTITIDSEKGVGTKVHVCIPFEKGELAQLEAHEFRNETIDLSGIKILVVDDEPYNRKLIRTILHKQHASIIEAVNGREAINAVESQIFQLILMDVQMPLVDGIEATKAIRKLNNQIPIVALSAAVSPEDLLNYERAGMQTHLAKPFQEIQLIRKIASVLSIPIEAMAADLMAPSQMNATEMDEEIDFGGLRDLSDGDTVFYMEMLEMFEQSTSEGIKKISEAITASNWNEAGEYAHKICAPCKHLSANRLYAYLKRIEESCFAEKELENLPELVEHATKEAERVLTIITNERLSMSNA